MKTNEQRINNIIGQLEGAKKMLKDKERDCFSLLVQLKAIKSATSSLMSAVITEELDFCLLGGKLEDKEKITKFFDEVIKK